MAPTIGGTPWRWTRPNNRGTATRRSYMTRCSASQSVLALEPPGSVVDPRVVIQHVAPCAPRGIELWPFDTVQQRELHELMILFLCSVSSRHVCEVMAARPKDVHGLSGTLARPPAGV